MDFKYLRLFHLDYYLSAFTSHSLHVIISFLIVRVFICDIVNIPLMSVSLVVIVSLLFDGLFVAQPILTGRYLTHRERPAITCWIVLAQCCVVTTVPTKSLSSLINSPGGNET